MTVPLPKLPGQIFTYENAEDGAKGGQMTVRRSHFDQFACYCDQLETRYPRSEAAVLEHLSKWAFDTLVWAHQVEEVVA